MTPHAIVQFLIYKIKAKGRHGTHSPFVYALVEELEIISNKSTSADKYQSLLDGLQQYLGYTTCTLVIEDMPPQGIFDMIIFNEQSNEHWLSNAQNYLPLLSQNGLIAIKGIHNTALHTEAWNNTCRNTMVKMSIDLYGVGLLLRNDEFKEKQHFLIKY